jgi:hypothetical protein
VPIRAKTHPSRRRPTSCCRAWSSRLEPRDPRPRREVLPAETAMRRLPSASVMPEGVRNRGLSTAYHGSHGSAVGSGRERGDRPDLPFGRSKCRSFVVDCRHWHGCKEPGLFRQATSEFRPGESKATLPALALRSNASNPGVDVIRLWEHENVESAYRVAEDLVPAREARGSHD